jgi:hypothetical protein
MVLCQSQPSDQENEDLPSLCCRPVPGKENRDLLSVPAPVPGFAQWQQHGSLGATVASAPASLLASPEGRRVARVRPRSALIEPYVHGLVSSLAL